MEGMRLNHKKYKSENWKGSKKEVTLDSKERSCGVKNKEFLGEEVQKLTVLFKEQVNKIEGMRKDLEVLMDENEKLKRQIQGLNGDVGEIEFYGVNLSVIKPDEDSEFFDKMERDEIKFCEIFEHTTGFSTLEDRSVISDLATRFVYFSHTVINF